jgi:3-methyladenine DNA glycosylase Tag
MTTYCDYCTSHPEDTFNRVYHDTQYGFPIKDDNLLRELQKEFGSFRGWLDANRMLSKEEWVKLFKKIYTDSG